MGSSVVVIGVGAAEGAGVSVGVVRVGKMSLGFHLAFPLGVHGLVSVSGPIYTVPVKAVCRACSLSLYSHDVNVTGP